MARCQARSTQPGHRAQPDPDHRHIGQIGRHHVETAGAADTTRQVGRALGFDGLDRAAAARALDDPHDRQAKRLGHFFGHQGFGSNRCIGRAAAHCEVVAHHHHRAAFDLAATEHAVGRGHAGQRVGCVVFADSRQGSHFLKAASIDQTIDALAHRETTAIMLTLDLVGAAHFMGKGLAACEFVEFRLPAHAVSPCGVCVVSVTCATPSAESDIAVRSVRRSVSP